MHVPKEIQKLPDVVRKAVVLQCNGDWSRVTLNPDGSLTVHNKPHVNGLKVRAKPVRKSVPREKIDPPKAVPRAPLTPGRIRPNVPTRAPRLTFEEPAAPPDRNAFVLLPGFELQELWTGEEFEKTAFALREHVRNGVGMQCPLEFHADVTALHGVDLVDVESVVRQSERVEVAPETAAKKYPVLKFARGDVLVVVGFRNPRLPMIIAAYWQALRLPSQGVSADQSDRSGGGGGRRTVGLPTTAKQLVKRLRDVGASVEDPSGEQMNVMVSFDGTDLGRVNVGPTATKTSCQSDYQRNLRRIASIRRRKAGA